jgi:hypothetical protein
MSHESRILVNSGLQVQVCHGDEERASLGLVYYEPLLYVGYNKSIEGEAKRARMITSTVGLRSLPSLSKKNERASCHRFEARFEARFDVQCV